MDGSKKTSKTATVLASGVVVGVGVSSVSIVDPTTRSENVKPTTVPANSGSAFDMGGLHSSAK